MVDDEAWSGKVLLCGGEGARREREGREGGTCEWFVVRMGLVFRGWPLDHWHAPASV
jgi:hypothetical protein